MTVEHTNSSIVHVTGATFDGVVTSERPVLLDFWAPWCGPCRAIAPVLEEIARELGDKVTIGKVNVDEHPDLAVRFGVQAIPQLLFFKEGALKDKLVGAVPQQRASHAPRPPQRGRLSPPASPSAAPDPHGSDVDDRAPLLGGRLPGGI